MSVAELNANKRLKQFSKTVVSRKNDVPMKHLFPFILFALPVVALFSCGKTEQLDYKPAPLTLVAEGPLFEGSNTAQGILSRTGLDAALQQSGLDAGKIAAARLTEVRISTTSDTLNLDNISAITLQLAAPGADMQQVAVLNPVPSGQKSLTLQIAGEQEKIARLLQQPELTCVADVNLRTDTDANLALRCELAFEISVRR